MTLMVERPAPEQTLEQVAVTQESADAAVQEYLGAAMIVHNTDARIRIEKDREGNLIKGAGALVIRCDVADTEGSKTKYIDVNDGHRPLPEPVITFYGAIADERFRAGSYIDRINLVHPGVA